MKEERNFKGKGLGVGTAKIFENEPKSMIHEQLARLVFAENKMDMKGKRVLDFGCGTGYNCYYIAERNFPKEVVGIDLLAECIEYARSKYSAKNVRFNEQDCLEYNEALGTFDFILTCEVIEHVKDQDRFIRNLKKYLSPGGYAYISTPNRATFSLGKEKSFLNPTHIKEFYPYDFRDFIQSNFSNCMFYSQIHKGHWHSAYLNYLTVANYIYAVRYECFQNVLLSKILAKLCRLLYFPILMSRCHPDVRKRKYTDFEFVEGFDSRAIWFVAIGQDL